MTKALHLALLEKPEKTQWVFCRWHCTHWPLAQNLNGISIILKQALGSRLTRSWVTLHGNQIGQIDFSAKRIS